MAVVIGIGGVGQGRLAMGFRHWVQEDGLELVN